MSRCLTTIAVVAALFAASDGRADEAGPVRPFETDNGTVAATQLDYLVMAAQHKRGIDQANPCSDQVFVRRVFLDVIGTLPDPVEVRAFLVDKRPDRRARLIDSLLARDEFADYWSLKWCDLLRVKSEFPINLWPNAAQAYQRFIRDAIRENRPYDRFARELLTSSGSNFRDPAVNFYRAVQGRGGATLASAAALTFMGSRIETWPAARRAGAAVFFSRVAYKKTSEWKEEIVLDDPSPRGALSAVLPDGVEVQIGADEDPRRVFADWLITQKNPWFARAVVNRVWSWLLGRGIVHEPDDIRPDNPPSMPEALAYLEKELVDSHWDLRRVYRRILESRTYQQSPLAKGADPAAAEKMFACYPVRRLPAEVLIDALDWIGGVGEQYMSTTPEPYTFIPQDRRTIALADGSITSPFLEMFGRPARDTGLESERNDAPSDEQRLWLLNSTDVQQRILRSPRLRAAADLARGDVVEMIRQTYLVVLSRYPAESEVVLAQAYFKTPGRSSRDAAADLAWALVNSKEFLYRH
jgi:hypothetical protein